MSDSKEIAPADQFKSEARNLNLETDNSSRPQQPEWAYFAEAVAWYPSGYALTGAQVMSVVDGLRQALRDGRIHPGDLGMEMVNPYNRQGHGLHCAYRSGHDCDCTARTATYWRVPK